MIQEPFWSDFGFLTTADFAGKLLASLIELCEEEEILAMAFGEGVPDLPRLPGLVAEEGAISNRNIDGGEVIRVSDFFVKIELNQFLIIGVEPITVRQFARLAFLGFAIPTWPFCQS
ncbi:hypothetical protein OIU74_028389 [Salix koriyanagi]|uniref:Uncharacterized protein n=1 Tax=Salix koriyanagi TaxID=2511006 RepID=A0A9Q0VDR1_9ROSI|nr:hypothetical protein OIU74_028389 [Salix koriyanagi]